MTSYNLPCHYKVWQALDINSCTVANVLLWFIKMCINRSRGCNRGLWHLRVRLHTWEDGIYTGIFTTNEAATLILSKILCFYNAFNLHVRLIHQASCRSLARLESIQDMHTTIYDVIRHVPETPSHSLLK